MATEEVGTDFKLADKASGPLAKIAEGYDAVDKRARAARQAAEQFSKRAPAMPKSAPAGQDSEKDRFSEIRSETRARRARVRGLKLEEQQGDIYENALGSLAGAVGGSANVFGRIGQITEATGFQMSAFEGKLGVVGKSLVGLGGTVGALGAAFSVGTALDAAFGELSKSLGGSGRSLSDLIAGVEDQREVQAQNVKVARSLGFADVAIMNSATAAFQRGQKERDLARRATEAAKGLGALPTDRTGAAMEAWAGAANRAVPKFLKAGDDVEKFNQLLMEAAERSSASWRSIANRNAEVELATGSIAEILAKEYPGREASIERTRDFNQSVEQLVDANIALHPELAQYRQQLLDASAAKAAESGNIYSIVGEMEKGVLEQQQVNALLASFRPKIMRGAGAMEDMQLAALDWAKSVAEKKGVLDPTIQKKLAEGAVSKATMTLSRAQVNFNNARFDIKQNFAEGFDPDRIAVAFTQDIVALGETRLQSGLAPIYSGR